MTMPDGGERSRGPGGAIASGGDAIQRLPYTQLDLERARRSSKVAETVAREILTDIVNRQLKSGHLIGSEAQMLERYRVARGSLREALRLLEVHGLIYIRAGPNGGAVVGAPTVTSFGRTATMYLQMAQATMGELHEALIVIEPVLVRYAAVLQNPVQLAALTANRLDGEQISLRDDMAYRVLVGQFHDIFTNTSGNRLLELFTGGLRSISTHRLGSAPVASRSAREKIVSAHAAITDAILAGDAAGAENLMRGHNEDVLTERKKKESPLFSEVIHWA
jgi:GntR family transcriptional regulator, transcriptional repressor for pyruvate dehydrogenase complex